MVKGKMRFRVNWVENSTPWGVLGAVFRWCDTAGLAAYNEVEAKEEDKALVKEWVEMWDGNGVMRNNSCEIYTNNMGKEVWVETCLSKVGRTSWGVSFEIFNVSMEKTLARMDTTIVHVDAKTHSRSVPIPQVEKLRKYVNSTGPKTNPHPPRDPSTAVSRKAFTTKVRVTDCDSLGHINNAVYPLLALESFPTDIIPPIGSCKVEYIKQILPEETLQVQTFLSNTPTPLYTSEFRVDGELVATCVTAPLQAGTSKL
eukprot:TRINITY_DN5328_c0_g2_i3.p1 TRINITY_DN5328_c0_g2~~TRINITY_DN5328_c0_g2_i3.p1  ORF type:complete len:282 (+),score=74.55 TRINITY_DN5328_c0_g2_i3:77-847(+)